MPAASQVPGALVTVAQARERVLGVARPLARERLEIAAALDRVLAEDVLAAGHVPPFRCSAMDGYALAAGPSERTLTVVGESRAGAPSDREPAAGEAIRISTGALVPTGASAVVRQEDVDERRRAIRTRVPVRTGANIRDDGEDMRAGQTVLSAGATLGPAALGAAVAAGARHVRVARRPAVAVLSTGDELRSAGEPLGPGEIHNTNAPMLTALARRSGAVLSAVTRPPDDRSRTRSELSAALERADLVIVSGGISIGPHDRVK